MAAAHTPQLVRRPLVAAALMLSAGAAWLPLSLPAALAGLALFATLSWWAAARRSLLSLLSFSIVFFFCGAALARLYTPPTETLSPALPKWPRRAPLLIEGVVTEAPARRPDSHSLTVDLTGFSLALSAPLRPAQGRLRLSVPGEGPPCAGPGDRLRAFARVRPIHEADFPGAVPFKALAARRGITLSARVSEADRCLRLRRAEHPLKVERLRDAIHAAIGRGLPGARGAVVRAFATGDTSGIPKDVNQSFIRSGLSHLLAVSGLNLAIISGLFVIGLAAVLRRIPAVSLGPGVAQSAALLALPFVGLYTLLVGASASAVRAAVMVAALLIAQASRYRRDAASALAIAVLAMVAVSPQTLSDVSFQLSFSAVLSLLFIQPRLSSILRLKERQPWLLRAGLEVVLASLAATLGTAPLVAYHFNRVSLIGLLSNLPAGPLSSLILVPLALIGGLLGTLSDALAAPVLWVAGEAAGLLLWIAQTSAAIPGAQLVLPTPTVLECLLFYLCLLLLWPDRWARRLGAAAGIALCLSAITPWLQATLREELIIHVLPVGHGDAAVLMMPGGDTVVIDVGPPGRGQDAASRVILPFLRQQRIGSVDLLILTHPDSDHIGGLSTLVDQIPVKELYTNGDHRKGDTPLTAALWALSPKTANNQTAPWRFSGASIEVLAPVDPQEHESANDASLVTMIRYQGHKILFTGDLEAPGEAALLARLPQDALQAEVLKLGHHGSKSSSSEAFLAAVRPEHALISVGRQDHFGLPNRVVLERAQKVGARVWRTDLCGDLKITVGEAGLSVDSYLECGR